MSGRPATSGRVPQPTGRSSCRVAAAKGSAGPKDGAGGRSTPRPSGGTRGKAVAGEGDKTASQPRVADRSVSPLVLKWETEQGTLLVGSDGPLQADKPGNGGLRLWTYSTLADAVSECEALSSGMSGKHSVYNTGFSGAKLVFNCNDDTSPQEIDKSLLMEDVARALDDLDGTIYTGCDLNTTEDDMTYLSSMSPYVLASIGSETDANVSTGHGVFGSIQGALDQRGGVKGKTFLVKGTGKVGRVVAELLVNSGAIVKTYDIFPESADIPGCENLSRAGGDWADTECDVFVPCSVSRFITPEVAGRLKCSLVVGASNVPFSGPEALDACLSRGIEFVSEAISSAGAVLGDSIEVHAADAYARARPSEIYAYVRHLTRSKTRELVEASAQSGRPMALSLDDVREDPYGTPSGAGFPDFLAGRTERHDVLVVGAGMAGTAAAYYLTKDQPGCRVAVVDSDVVASKWASSYGESRMYRQMYSDPYFSRMQTEALRYWRDIESETGAEILRENGLLFYGETDTGETVEGSVPGARDVMVELGLEHEYFETGAEMTARWPDLRAPEEYQGVYEATAGRVHASRACESMMEAARGRGAALHEGERIDDMWRDADTGGMSAITSEGRLIKAKKVVVAAGAWTNKVLASLGCALDLEVHSVAYGHYRLTEEAAGRFPQWFCFRKGRGGMDGGLYYGFPPEDPAVPVVKVGIDFTPDHLVSPTADAFSYEAQAQVAQLIDDFMAENWDGVVERVDMQCSPYTMTRDNYFVLDAVPGMEDVIVFTGGNGRAFKFGPLLGKCLADLALGKEPSFDVRPFSLSREALNLRVQQDGAGAKSLA